jgi:type VI secretion system protein ImpL
MNMSAYGILLRIGIPCALATAAVWAVNSYVSPEAAKKLLAVILIFAAVLLVVFLLIWALKKLFSGMSSARKRSKAAKEAAPVEGLAPEDRAALDALQGNIDVALRVVRESKMARGRKGDEALYAFPWVALFGAPESGKTTLLRESGVEFPYSTAGESRKSRRGGVDAGCDFWFSREAVVLDMSGNLAVDDNEIDVFKGFLDRLKRARRERPVDGVIVTVPVTELQQGAGQVEGLANRLRQRFDEMTRRLGIRFPVYVVFTKCDQLEGFAEFFRSFRSRDRAQVCGATISRDLRKQLPVEDIFTQEFARIAESMRAYRLQALAAEKDPIRLAKVFAFPEQFAALGGRLSPFIGSLFQATPYSERPIFRGFYLTSAGVPAIVESRPEPADFRWDAARQVQAAQQEPAQAKSYFLESLLPRVVFADRPQVKESVDTRLKRRLWLDIAFFGTIALCTALLVGMTYSFMENRSLIESTRLAAMRLTDAGWDGKRASDLASLQQLRERLDELDRYEAEGPKWTMRWGLYSGGQMVQSGRRVYFRRLRASFVAPTADTLRQKLTAYATAPSGTANYNEFHSYLQAYLMMTEPQRSEESFLMNTLAPIWKTFGPAEAESVVLDQLRFYAKQLPKNDPELQLTRDPGVVSLARRSLAQFPALERVYMRLKIEGNSKYQPFTLAVATGGKSLEYLNSTHDVPGVFTEAGWSGYFKNATGQAGKEMVQDDWVVGPTYSNPNDTRSDSDFERQIRDKYFTEYIEEWQKFVEGISVRPLADLNEARAALDSFSQQDSAISRLLMNVAANTMLRKEPEKGNSITSMVSSTLATLGLSTRVNRAELVDSVADQFQALHDVVTSPDGGKTPSMLAGYILALSKVHQRLEALFGAGTQWDQVKAYVDMIANNLSSNEFQEGYRITSLIGKQCRTRSTQPVNPMLEQPLRQTWAAILREVGFRLDGLWKTQIAEQYRRDIESGFPFNVSGQDLPVATLSQFLKPREGTLDAFFEKELKMFVTLNGTSYTPRPLFNSQVAFSAQFLEFLEKTNTLRQALYPPGVPDISTVFDLTPDATPGVTESLLEVDGQKILYRNERPVPTVITWPGKSGSPQAKLSISLTGSGERPNIPAIEGEWAFFRLLSQARVVPQSQTLYLVSWSLPSADGRKLEVRYKLQSRSFRNPFPPNFFRIVNCPETVTQPSSAVAGLTPSR